MARPKKVGLEYFPLDCKMDDKVEILEAEYGLEGFAVYIKLLQEIYQTDEGVLDMSVVFRWKTLGKRYGIDGKQLENIINLCLEVGLFCKVCYADGQKLTSNGVKKRLGKVSDMRNKDRSRKSEQVDEFSDGKPSENSRKSTQKEKEKESTKRTVKASKDARDKRAHTDKPKEKKAVKTAYRDNVLLTETEYKTLVEKHGQLTAEQCLDKLSAFKLAKGKSYESDYGAINMWVVNAVAEDAQRISRNGSNRPPSSNTPPRPPEPNPSTFGTPATKEFQEARAQASMEAKREREAAPLPF